MFYFAQNLKTQLHNRTFKGRLSRNDFWSFVLIGVPMMYAAFTQLVYLKSLALLGTGVPGVVYMLGTALMVIALIYMFFALICANVRRLHDSGLSGWLWWIQLIPYVGIFVYLYFLARNTNEKGDKYTII